jgi:hypothetical protein
LNNSNASTTIKVKRWTFNKIFFLFPMGFPTNSQLVFAMFPIFPMCSPNVPNSTSFYPISFAPSFSFVTNINNLHGGNHNTFILGLPKI